MVSLSAAAFWLLALTILGAALLVVMSKNIVHSVLWLIVVFLGIAGVFLMLGAKFLAAIQILVYAGAVCIMVVFGVMLTQREDMSKSNIFNKRMLTAAPVVGLLLVVSGTLAFKSVDKAPVNGGSVPTNTVEAIGELLLSKYVVPFEVAAILLLVALIGAVFLSMEVKPDADND
ncbi:MAG: NADH-quinone oxidoreductase subunit J [Firmicutes bacterium]|nr:NADH-quinone oxidoreductase subunit J [Bacillota bacterium]